MTKQPTFVKTSEHSYLRMLMPSLRPVGTSEEEQLASKGRSTEIETWWKEQACSVIFQRHSIDIAEEEARGFTFTIEGLDNSLHGEFTLNQFAVHGMMPDKPVCVFRINKNDILTR